MQSPWQTRNAFLTDVALEDFDRISRTVPAIANIRPNGTSAYLMEDFDCAGGLPALMKRLEPHLHLDELTVSGLTVRGNLEGAQVYNDDVIRTLDNAVSNEGSLAMRKGNLAPRRLRHQAQRDEREVPAAQRPGGGVRRLAIGGNLALVKTGDIVGVDVPNRRIHLDVSDDELARRRAKWTPPAPRFERGYGWMFSEHILQADQGCGMDFLQTQFGATAGEPDIF
ncbi:hypothetical protein AX767_04130 [Variovorax sp. PAMC 28711]|nr:hypothetical protein AX767_04130 [Variovorax sp. PAMC 28711]